MTELKRLRLQKRISQREASERIGVSLRTYVTYENDTSKERTAKYRFLLSEIIAMNSVDEEHGILSVEDIQKGCAKVLAQYPVEYCILFGSYARGTASEKSDVDLVLGGNVSGLQFFEIAELLRENLQKKVDLLDIKQLVGNEELLSEVLRDGKRVYGKQ